MGVLACSKNNCTHIMCDTYVREVGYICFDCQKDFEKWLQYKEINPKTEGEIVRHLIDFVEIPKGDPNGENPISIGEFFRNHTT